jgi:hypothetical protein
MSQRVASIACAASQRKPLSYAAWIATVVIGITLVTACATRTRVIATNAALALSPTCGDAVRVFPDRDHVPYDYYEVALITSAGNPAYSGNGDVLKAIRNKAADLGANGVVVSSLEATHATVKIIGAAVGANDAGRKANAVAIWMPSDTARVREACGEK